MKYNTIDELTVDVHNAISYVLEVSPDTIINLPIYRKINTPNYLTYGYKYDDGRISCMIELLGNLTEDGSQIDIWYFSVRFGENLDEMKSHKLDSSEKIVDELNRLYLEWGRSNTNNVRHDIIKAISNKNTIKKQEKTTKNKTLNTNNTHEILESIGLLLIKLANKLKEEE